MSELSVVAGTWFCLPLLTGGFGLGLTVASDGLHNLSVFFARRYERVPQLDEMAELTPGDVRIAWSIAAAEVGNKWPKVGVLEDWNEAEWLELPAVRSVLSNYKNSIMGSGLLMMRLDEIAEPPIFPLVPPGERVTVAQPLVIRLGRISGEFCLDFLLSPTSQHELMLRGGLPETWPTWRALLAVYAAEELKQVQIVEHQDHVELIGGAKAVHKLQWTLLYMWWSRSMFLDAISQARSAGTIVVG